MLGIWIAAHVGEQKSIRYFFVRPRKHAPPEDGIEHYKLLVQKQAGTPARQLTVRVTLPESAILLSSIPPARIGPDRQVVFQNMLSTDLTFDVAYRQ